jgi:hypothetical protein
MRFRLRFQKDWTENLRLIWPLLGLALAVAELALDVRRWLPWTQAACWLLMLLSSAPGYCEVGEDGLLLRRSWGSRKTLIPYDSLAELSPRRDAYGVIAVTGAGKRLQIPVAETPLFLRAAYQRFPRLNPASAPPSFGLNS